MKPAVFRNCNVCGRSLVREDELAVGVCAICANEELEEVECASCHLTFMGSAEERLCEKCERKVAIK